MSETSPQGAPNHEFLMQFFEYAHLPLRLADVSKPFSELAKHIVNTVPRNPERTVALRKLLEAKDCAVRAMVAVPDPVVTRGPPLEPQRFGGP